jgi:hypothetical protein
MMSKLIIWQWLNMAYKLSSTHNKMKSSVFWNIRLCSPLKVNWWKIMSPQSSELKSRWQVELPKMELYKNCCENLKCYIQQNVQVSILTWESWRSAYLHQGVPLAVLHCHTASTLGRTSPLCVLWGSLHRQMIRGWRTEEKHVIRKEIKNTARRCMWNKWKRRN